MNLINLIFTLIICVLIGVLFYIRKYHKYWSNANIPFIKPQFFTGNLFSTDGKKTHIAFLTQRYYNELKNYKTPFGGIYFFYKPIVIATQLDFIKSILIKDFNHFHDRGIYHNERDDPLSANLLTIEGEKWKRLRSKLSPTFTSGKMKFMYPTILKVAENLENCVKQTIIQNQQNNSSTIDIREVLARFTTDVIGTCAFGIDCNSLSDPNAEFRQMGKRVFGTATPNFATRMLIGSYKKLSKLLRIQVNDKKLSTFFLNAVKETVEYRELNNIRRNDFMDILIKLKNSNQQHIDIENNHDKDENEMDAFINNNDDDNHLQELPRLTLNEISAQAFIFFIAGFETSSITMTFCLSELAMNVDIQQKVRNEIKNVLLKHNNCLTYDAIMEMHYLEQVIYETLRKYPPIGNLVREVTQDYYVPEVKCTLKKGLQVFIPLYAIQHDSKYYPEPERFDPERFAPTETKKRDPMTFLSFGNGPRNCIGLRFGLMQTRIGLVTILNKFQVTPSSAMKYPIPISNAGFVFAPENDILLDINEIIE